MDYYWPCRNMISLIKIRFLPSCSHVGATVCLHHLDSNEMPIEKDSMQPPCVVSVLNKSWKQCPTKQQLYDYILSILQTIQDMLGTAREVRKNSPVTFFYRLLNMGTPVFTDQQKLTFISCVDPGLHQEDLPRAMTN